MYWNMKSENPIKKEGDLLLSCNPVSTFWFLVIRYFKKKSFFIPVSSGYPLMIILLRGWICVASLRKRWPSANDIFILYSNKAQRVKKDNLARGKRALLKKKLEYTFDLHEFCFGQYPRIILLPTVLCLINHIDYMINTWSD